MTAGFTCPVCAYHDSFALPYLDGAENWYQEICPCCGTQFGYDDATRSHDELRTRWILSGAQWSTGAASPQFNGIEQLLKAGLIA